MKHLFILAALLAGSAHADTVGVHLVSRHATPNFERSWSDGTKTQVAYNNRNFGAYWAADSGALVGAYRNSYSRTTVYAGWTWDAPRIGPVTPAVSAVLATGYDNMRGHGKLRPMLMPSLRAPLGTVSVRWSVAPATKGGFFQHLSVERAL
jgi:hypothetical protein